MVKLELFLLVSKFLVYIGWDEWFNYYEEQKLEGLVII